jgi:hypothetical protein
MPIQGNYIGPLTAKSLGSVNIIQKQGTFPDQDMFLLIYHKRVLEGEFWPQWRASIVGDGVDPTTYLGNVVQYCQHNCAEVSRNHFHLVSSHNP